MTHIEEGCKVVRSCNLGPSAWNEARRSRLWMHFQGSVGSCFHVPFCSFVMLRKLKISFVHPKITPRQADVFQMPAGQTGQTSAAETRQMPAASESSGSAWACGASAGSTRRGLTRGEESEEGSVHY